MSRDPVRVLITGGGSGIGRALAVEAARRGMAVAICGRRAEAIEETVRMLKSPHPALAVQADLTLPEDRRRLAVHLAETWGGLDILVNNAGMLAGGPIEEVGDAALSAVFAINVLAPMALTRDLAPLLRAGRDPRVVNIGSIFGDIPYPLLTAYSASKFALRGFSSALRREWKAHGIAVTYVAPRATRTRALADLAALMPEGTMRVDPPEDVAAYIWKSVGRGAKSVYVPGPERAFVLLQRTFPGLIDRALSRSASSATA
jgi:NAD(P)-dependent dehydrogenase (short-subunit alcohol dehydrogenase family)